MPKLSGDINVARVLLHYAIATLSNRCVYHLVGSYVSACGFGFPLVAAFSNRLRTSGADVK